MLCAHLQCCAAHMQCYAAHLQFCAAHMQCCAAHLNIMHMLRIESFTTKAPAAAVM